MLFLSCVLRETLLAMLEVVFSSKICNSNIVFDYSKAYKLNVRAWNFNWGFKFWIFILTNRICWKLTTENSMTVFYKRYMKSHMKMIWNIFPLLLMWALILFLRLVTTSFSLWMNIEYEYDAWSIFSGSPCYLCKKHIWHTYCALFRMIIPFQMEIEIYLLLMGWQMPRLKEDSRLFIRIYSLLRLLGSSTLTC